MSFGQTPPRQCLSIYCRFHRCHRLKSFSTHFRILSTLTIYVFRRLIGRRQSAVTQIMQKKDETKKNRMEWLADTHQ